MTGDEGKQTFKARREFSSAIRRAITAHRAKCGDDDLIVDAPIRELIIFAARKHITTLSLIQKVAIVADNMPPLLELNRDGRPDRENFLRDLGQWIKP